MASFLIIIQRQGQKGPGGVSLPESDLEGIYQKVRVQQDFFFSSVSPMNLLLRSLLQIRITAIYANRESNLCFT